MSNTLDFILHDLDSKQKEKHLHEMQSWALEHGLLNEFNDQVLCSREFPIFTDEALVKRFGYFVLENTN